MRMQLNDRNVEAAIEAARQHGIAEGRAQGHKAAVRSAVAAALAATKRPPQPPKPKPRPKPKAAAVPPRVIEHLCAGLHPLGRTRGRVVLDRHGRGTCDYCGRSMWADS